jgi:hypothetical protein
MDRFGNEIFREAADSPVPAIYPLVESLGAIDRISDP